MAKPKKVHTSALCWVPAIESQPPIQTLRLVHDRQIGRWPPHVNVLYPFVPEAEFEAAAGRLAAALQPLPAFGVTLGRLDRFVHGRRLPTRAPAHAFHALLYARARTHIDTPCTHTARGVGHRRRGLTAWLAPEPDDVSSDGGDPWQALQATPTVARVHRTFLGDRAERTPPSATLSRSYRLMGCVAAALQSAIEE